MSTRAEAARNISSSIVSKRESTKASPNASQFEVILISEGLGNFGDAFYYTKEALESGVSVFEGEQLRLNHSTPEEEDQRPEGDVEKVSGYYKELYVKEGKGGQHHLCGIAVVPAGASFDKARDRMQACVEYAQHFTEKDFIGLSINASGDAEEQDIDEVIKAAPEACKAKLLEAKEQGIDSVRVTNRITKADSCDLVTKAGAGGKVLKLIESAKEKREMAKNTAKKKEGDKGHDDADQDKTLIKSMLDKHDKDGEHDEAGMESVHQAHQAYQAMGHSKEEAAELAVKHVKAAKAMAQKQKKEKGEGEGEGEVVPPKKKPADEEEETEEAEESEGEAEESEGEGKKESEKRVLKLSAENSVLKERLTKLELRTHKEEKLAESKLPRAVTKIFLESVKDVKSVKEFDRALAQFIQLREAAQAGEGEETYQESDKGEMGGSAGSGLSFSDASED